MELQSTKIGTHFTLLFLGITISLLSICTAFGADYYVANASDIDLAMLTAQAGDNLIMSNGTWTNQQIDFEGFGTAGNPITLRAETPGEVILNGNSSLDISGEWLTVDGLRFEGGALTSGHVIEFKGSYGEASNSRFTNSAIIDYNPADVNTRYNWVSLYGQNNRVDNNRFEGQNHSGVTVVVWRDDNSADHHLIDSNHFVDRPEPINPDSTNGFESIRIGTGEFAFSDSFTTVENNLFERVDGEIEIISNKSQNNVFRYNTFRESKGTLTLRRGHENLVEGNFFLGQNKIGSGGIRVIGERQTIINNYIANVDDRSEGAISISAGTLTSEPGGYSQVKEALIAHNTIVNTLGNTLTFDNGLGSDGRSELAENVTVANNIFRSSGSAIFEGNEGSGWSWQGNIAYGGSLGPKDGALGITETDPQLQLTSDGLWRISSTSPAINNGSGDFSSILANDMDGQARIGIFDVGADEFSNASISRKPLHADDVGPSWFLSPVAPPSLSGCFATHCAIQAESYTMVTDPDGNGLVWTAINDEDALGGVALKAPLGSRIDLPADTHDSLATYDLIFLEPGTYRAYYRAKGFNTSTDSLYVPANFDTDPEVSETTSSDNTFRWESGGVFQITESNVGVPLEFRIGKREQSTLIDSFVLSQNLSLTSAELDALFTPLLGDLNLDGFVDSLDLGILLGNWGLTSSTAQGELNGTPPINSLDLGILLGNWKLPPISVAIIVPEPSSPLVLLVFLCSFCLLRVRYSF